METETGVFEEIVGHGWVTLILTDPFGVPIDAYPPHRCQVEAVAFFWPIPTWSSADVAAGLRFVEQPPTVKLPAAALPPVVHNATVTARAGILALAPPTVLADHGVDRDHPDSTVTFDWDRQPFAFTAELSGASSAVVRAIATQLATMCDSRRDVHA